jgi:hypothetical protein
MGIVVEGGMVRPGDDIVARRPEGQPLPLLPV